MLQIRSEQMKALSEQLLKKFEDRLVAHLGEVFPKRCAALGGERVAALVKDGTQRAQKYGVVAERDVAMFVDLMLVVRPDFDVARETPWANPIVADNSLSGPQKVTRLFAEARRNRFRIVDEVPAAAAPADAAPGTATSSPGARPAPPPGQTTPAARPPIAPRPPQQKPAAPSRPPTSIGSVPPL